MIIRLRELGRGSDHPDREELVVSREIEGMIHPNPSSLDKAPRLIIRLLFGFVSDSETSAATPCEVMQKK